MKTVAEFLAGSFTIQTENRQKQVEDWQTQLRARIGEAVVWHRFVTRYGEATSVDATIVDVKFNTQTWFIIRDTDGKLHRVRTHNVSKKR